MSSKIAEKERFLKNNA